MEISIKNKEREKKKTLSVDPGQSAEIDRNAYSTRAKNVVWSFSPG